MNGVADRGFLFEFYVILGEFKKLDFVVMDV